MVNKVHCFLCNKEIPDTTSMVVKNGVFNVKVKPSVFKKCQPPAKVHRLETCPSCKHIPKVALYD